MNKFILCFVLLFCGNLSFAGIAPVSTGEGIIEKLAGDSITILTNRTTITIKRNEVIHGEIKIGSLITYKKENKNFMKK